MIRWLRPIRPSLVPVRRLSWQTWSLLGVPSIAGSDIPPAAPPCPVMAAAVGTNTTPSNLQIDAMMRLYPLTLR